MIRLRQVCFAAPSISYAGELAEIFGVIIAYRDPLIIEFGLENALLGFGGTFVEFIAPLKESTPATRFLAKHPGGGGYMVIHDTDEYASIRSRVDEQGVRIAFESTPELRDAAQNRAENGFDSFRHVQLDPRSVGGTLMEFNQNDGGEDLFGNYAPAGGDGWQSGVQGEDLPKIVATECMSTDPDTTAATWAALMGKPVKDDNGQPTIILDGGGVDRFVAGPAEAFHRLFIDTAEPKDVLARARSHGYDTTGSKFQFCGVEFVVVPR